jgi:uncharacterized membrane protein
VSQLLVFGVDSPQTAEKVLDLAGDLAKQQLLELADAAWVERTPDGKVKLHQSVNLTAAMAGTGAVTGALWGTLIGLLFLNPLAGAVVGAGSRRGQGRGPAGGLRPATSSGSGGTAPPCRRSADGRAGSG